MLDQGEGQGKLCQGGIWVSVGGMCLLGLSLGDADEVWGGGFEETDRDCTCG